MYMPSELCCPAHQSRLSQDKAGRVEDAGFLRCPLGCSFPVVEDIPRFVESSNYAAAFGRQWKMFRRTQLDSYTRTTIFRDRLRGACGGSLDILAGKTVFEAGCGAGAFTEVLLSEGATVFACDLSTAVEANYANCRSSANYFVCQANILRPPVAAQSFDIVICLGVIQHTPNPEETIATLAKCLKPGGMLILDHYPPNYPYTLPRRMIRPLLLKLPRSLSTRVALALARALLPLHRWMRTARGFWRLRPLLLKVSPLVDHFDDYPQLGEKLVGEWCVLNTHDTLTDYYKHVRSAEQIRECLVSCGLTDIEVRYGGNGVEARARKPVVSASKEVPATVAEVASS
jgi:SAM-dependent methyltransferase